MTLRSDPATGGVVPEIGSAIVREFIQAGHEVVGLARSDASAQALRDAGSGVHRGDLHDFDTLTAGARESDGVVHVGFVHDFTKYKQMCGLDRHVTCISPLQKHSYIRIYSCNQCNSGSA